MNFIYIFALLAHMVVIHSLITNRMSIAFKISKQLPTNMSGQFIPQITFYPPLILDNNEIWDAGEIPWDLNNYNSTMNIIDKVLAIIFPAHPNQHWVQMIFI